MATAKSPEDGLAKWRQQAELADVGVAQAEARPARLGQADVPASGLESAENRVDAYRVPKIPSFFRGDPDLWFLQVEIAFRNARITAEATQADCVLGALDAEVLSAVRDILLMRPPPPDIYRRIKSRLIATFGVSPEARLRKLLKGQVLTDGKPSLVLSRLRSLNDGACDDAVVRSVFMDQLPSFHRVVLTALGDDDLGRLAGVADRLADITGVPDVYAASVGHLPRPSSSRDDDIAILSASVASLAEKVERIEARLSAPRPRSGSRSRPHARSRPHPGSYGSRGRSAERDLPRLCVAHAKYPDNPTSCKSWCARFASWQAKN